MEKVKKIVLLTGVFDLLHPGHFAIIREIHKAYPHHRLVVGVNGDRRTAELKDTVLFSASDRVNMIMGMKHVDGWIVFDEDTPAELIISIKPDVFVKGPEYKDVELPEQYACDEVGCEVVFIGEKINNSSQLKKRIVDC